LSLNQTGAITSAHVIEPVNTTESEKWFDIMINNYDIIAIVAIVLYESNALINLLDGTVQILDTLLNDLKLNCVITWLASLFLDFDFNCGNLLTDSIWPCNWLVVSSLKGSKIDFEFLVSWLERSAVSVDTVDLDDQIWDEFFYLSKSDGFSIKFSSKSSNLSNNCSSLALKFGESLFKGGNLNINLISLGNELIDGAS
jgi:hypothetical protein